MSLQYRYQSLGLAWTAGIGSNTPFAAVLGKFENQSRTFAAKLGYTSVQNDFRRLLVSAPLVSENSGLNFEGIWIPLSNLRFSGTHARVLSPVSNAPSIPATINTEGMSYQIGRVLVRAANYSSTALQVHNSGQDYGTDVRLFAGIAVHEEYLKSRGDITISSVSETVRRFQFTQNITRSTQLGKTQSGFDGGVSYHGSQLNWTAEFQEEYFPYSLPGQSPFRRVFSVSFQKAIKDAVIGGQTFVDPNNHMRFTVSGQDYLYGPRPVESSRVFSQRHSIGNFIVSGIVRDTHGQPVYGAVVQVDGSIVYSGTDGHFFVRFRKPGTVPVCISTSNFIEGSWRLISAPMTATALPEAQDKFIEIVVERTQR
jgi:hypothetical protein